MCLSLGKHPNPGNVWEKKKKNLSKPKGPVQFVLGGVCWDTGPGSGLGSGPELGPKRAGEHPLGFPCGAGLWAPGATCLCLRPAEGGDRK